MTTLPNLHYTCGMGDERFITIKEAAKKLRVSQNTVRRMFDSNEIDGFRTPAGHRRLYRGDVLRIARQSIQPDQGIIFE